MDKSENKIITNKSKSSTPILYVMIAVASGFFGGYFGSQANVLEGSENTTKVQREIIEGEGNLINTIAKDVSPSVVSINVTSTAISQDFFGIGREF